MLHRFLQAKQKEIQELKNLAEQGLLPEPALPSSRPGMQEALLAFGPGAVIAEYKRASPSREEINPDLSPEGAAQAFVQGGAAAVSVLTMPQFFQGKLDFLQQISPYGLPLLRKGLLWASFYGYQDIVEVIRNT